MVYIHSPTTCEPVGADLDIPAFSEDWEFSLNIGMHMYLAENILAVILHTLCIRLLDSHTIPGIIML